MFMVRIQEEEHMRELTGEIIAYESPHIVAYRDGAAQGMATVRYTLEAVTGGTRIRVSADAAPGTTSCAWKMGRSPSIGSKRISSA